MMQCVCDTGTGRHDRGMIREVQLVQTPHRALSDDPQATSHACVIPTRYTSGARHMPTVPGTRHNILLPASEAEAQGHHAFHLQDYKRACRCYQKALEEAPNPFVRRCLAASLAHMADLQGALMQTAEMVRLEPFNKKSRFLNKVCNYRSDDPHTALIPVWITRPARLELSPLA